MGHLATAIIPILLGAGVVPSMPALITLRGFLFAPVLYKAMSATNWSLYNPSNKGQSRLIVRYNTWFPRRIQHRDFLLSNPDILAAQKKLVRKPGWIIRRLDLYVTRVLSI